MDSLAQARKKLCSEALKWPTGLDMTGENLIIPQGYLRIFETQAQEYVKAGYVVTTKEVLNNNSVKVLWLVDIRATLAKHNAWPPQKESYDNPQRSTAVV